MQEGLKELRSTLSAFSWENAEKRYEKYRNDQKNAATAKATDARIAALPTSVTSRADAKRIFEENQKMNALPKQVRDLCHGTARLFSLCAEAEHFIQSADKSESDTLDTKFLSLLNEENSVARCEKIAALHASLASLNEKIRAGAPHFSAFLSLYRALPTLKEAARVDGAIRALNPNIRLVAEAQRILAYKKKFDTLPEAVRKACTQTALLQARVDTANAAIRKSREDAAQALDRELTALLAEENSEARCARIKDMKAKLSSVEAEARALLKNAVAFEALHAKLPVLEKAAVTDADLYRASLAQKDEKWANATLALLENLKNLHPSVAAECKRLSLRDSLRADANKEIMKAKLSRYKIGIQRLMQEAKSKNTLAAHDALIEAYENRALTAEEEQTAEQFLNLFKKCYEDSKKAIALLLAKEASPYVGAMSAPADFAKIEKLDAEKAAHKRALSTISDFQAKWALTIESSIRLAKENGKRLFASQKYADALAPLAYAAKNDVGEAALLCAKIYEEGLSKKVNAEEAFRYYQLADRKREAEAAYHLGDFYLRGFGTPKDFSAGLRYLEKAADKKSIPAIARLGALYLDGTGVKRDYTKALSYLKVAAAAKDASAEYDLGRMLEQGLGAEVDLDGAYKLYTSAARALTAAKERMTALKKQLDEAEALDKELAALITMQNSLARVERIEDAKKRYDALSPVLAARCRSYPRFSEIHEKLYAYRTSAKLDALYETAIRHRGQSDFVEHAERFIKNFHAHRTAATQYCTAAKEIGSLMAEIQRVKHASLVEMAKATYGRCAAAALSSATLTACRKAITEMTDLLKDEALLLSLDAALCQNCKGLLTALYQRRAAIYEKDAAPFIAAMNHTADYQKILDLDTEVASHKEALVATVPDFFNRWQDALTTAKRLHREALDRIAAERARAEQEKKEAKDREINRCYQLAMCNDAKAQYKLACYYLYGDGVTRDYGMAVEFFEKAAHRGNRDAMEMLGDCYKHGWGVPISLSKAEKWYKKALK